MGPKFIPVDAVKIEVDGDKNSWGTSSTFSGMVLIWGYSSNTAEGGVAKCAEEMLCTGEGVACAQTPPTTCLILSGNETSINPL